MVCEGLGLAKPRDTIFVHGKVESKWTLDRDAAIAEVFVVEDADMFTFLERAVTPRDVVPLVVAYFVAFIAERLSHFFKEAGAVHHLNLSPAAWFFPIGNDPEIGVNAVL